MKNWKDTLTSVCALVIAICGGITGLNLGGAFTLPTWLITICGLLVVIAGALIGWATGKNPNLTAKTDTQVSKLNTGG